MYEVLLDPVDGNSSGKSGVNEGGLIVYITNGEKRKELTRVAFNRKNSSQPKKSLDKAITEEVQAAQLVADKINERAAAVNTTIKHAADGVDLTALRAELNKRSLNLEQIKAQAQAVIDNVDSIYQKVEEAEEAFLSIETDTPPYDSTLR